MDYRPIAETDAQMFGALSFDGESDEDIENDEISDEGLDDGTKDEDNE